MRKIAVTYELSDEEEKRLKKITEEYRRQGLDWTPDKVFESIMLSGSELDIKLKFKTLEQFFGKEA